VAAVVVPIYGVRDYLDECLASIAAQTIAGQLEVVLVDDGSVDGSGEVADAWARGRAQWTVIHQENAGPGPGAARNAGLSMVRAPYVLFCDGDDVLEPTAMEALLEAARTTGADVVVGAAEQVPVPRTWLWSHLFEPLDGTVRTGTIDHFPDLIHHPAPGDKLFRVAYLRQHDLSFAEGIHHQDTYVTVPAVLGPARITILRSVVQRYRRRSDGSSIMDQRYTRAKSTWDHLQVVEHLNSLRERIEADRALILDRFLVRSFQGFLARAFLLPEADRSELYRRVREVYAGVEPRTVLEAAEAAVHVLPYAAVLDDDPVMFAQAGRRVSEVRGDESGLRLVAPTRPLWRDAMTVGRLRGSVGGMSLTRDFAVLTGSIRLTGAPALVDLPVSVSLRARGAGLTVPMALERALGDNALTVSEFTVRLPLDELADGTHDLRAVLELTAGEQRSGRLRVVSSTTVTRRGRTLALGASADGAAQLTVQRAGRRSWLSAGS
jgi:glycosyltransferase involved in cell wall biosynthesis